MTATQNCGTAEHPDDCLCDVILTGAPTPINHRLNDVWHMEIIMRHMKLSNPYSPADLAKMLEALGAGFDATRNVATQDNTPIDGMYAAREELFELLRAGNSIIDIPEMLDIEWGAVLQILTANNASRLWTWTEQDWATAEDFIRDPDGPSADDAALLLNLNVNTVRDLWEWYGGDFGAAQSRRDAAAKRKILGENWDKTNLQLVDVFAEQGVEMDNVQIGRLRFKMKKAFPNGPLVEAMAS